MTSADGGATYIFGTDAGSNNIVPLGDAEIFPDLASIPDCPLAEYDQYLIEGDKIRIPNNGTMTFAAGPYARFWTPTYAIDASTQPTLKPIQARGVFVWDAIIKYAAPSKNLSNLLDLAQTNSTKAWESLMYRYANTWMQSGSVAMWGRPYGRGRMGNWNPNTFGPSLFRRFGF